jgi:hypothetical protein
LLLLLLLLLLADCQLNHGCLIGRHVLQHKQQLLLPAACAAAPKAVAAAAAGAACWKRLLLLLLLLRGCEGVRVQTGSPLLLLLLLMLAAAASERGTPPSRSSSSIVSCGSRQKHLISQEMVHQQGAGTCNCKISMRSCRDPVTFTTKRTQYLLGPKCLYTAADA